jgi:hypothetical protein
VIIGSSTSPLNIELSQGQIYKLAPDYYARSNLTLESLGANTGSKSRPFADGNPSGDKYGEGTRFTGNNGYCFDVSQIMADLMTPFKSS